MLISKDQIPEYDNIGDLSNITVRAVMVEGKPSGEYHAKSEKISASRLCSIIRGMMEDTEARIIDPDNALKLEYPVYIKVNSVLVNEMIDDYIKKINKYIGDITE